MEQVAVKLKQNLQAGLLVVADTAEERCITLMVGRLDDILRKSKLADHGCELFMAVGYRVMKGVASTLVLDDE